MVESEKSSSRIRILVATHVALGLMLAFFRLKPPQLLPTHPIEIDHAFIVSELWLLAIWFGLGGSRFWLKSLGIPLGIIWLDVVLYTEPTGSLSPSVLLEFRRGIVLAATKSFGFFMFIVGGGLMAYGKTVAKIRCCSELQKPYVSPELQFSMKNLLLLTATVGAVLAGRSVLELLHAPNYDNAQTAFAHGLCGLFSAWLLVWAVLGGDRLRIRIPLALVAMPFLGLVVPYYLGGSYLYPAVMNTSIAILTVGSLLVIRRWGCRLVPVRTTPSASDAVNEQALA